MARGCRAVVGAPSARASSRAARAPGAVGASQRRASSHARRAAEEEGPELVAAPAADETPSSQEEESPLSELAASFGPFMANPAPEPRQDRRRPGRRDDKEEKDDFEERVIEVKRVTKVTKGGKLMNFRAVVVVGDLNGTVGVGVAKAAEVVVAVQKAARQAKANTITVPLTKNRSIPHAWKVKGDGGAKVLLFPAGEGTGVIAGGACRSVLELAGVQNVFSKQRGSPNLLNNARAVIKGLSEMRTPEMVAEQRGFESVEELMAVR